MKTVIARTVWLLDMRLSPGSTFGDTRSDMEVKGKGEVALMDRWQVKQNGPIVEFSVP